MKFKGMTHNNNHHPSCDHAEQIVSFLYNEINEAEKKNFESHLVNCSSCADELAGFSIVRSSIHEWRSEEFANLLTPSFEIPAVAKVQSGSASWLESIRAFLSFPLTWGAVALPLILIFAGLFWFTMSTSNKLDVAENKTETINKTIPASNTQNVVNDSVEAVKNEKAKTAESSVKPSITDKNNSEKFVANSSEETNKNKRASLQPVKLKNFAPDKSDRNVAKTPVRKSKPASVPRLAGEDEEEESLRLSDILDEVSLR
jgi:hypothetical protein